MAQNHRSIPTLTPEEITRFKQRIDHKSEQDCWEWKAACSRAGYGQIRFRGR